MKVNYEQIPTQALWDRIRDQKAQIARQKQELIDLEWQTSCKAEQQADEIARLREESAGWRGSQEVTARLLADAEAEVRRLQRRIVAADGLAEAVNSRACADWDDIKTALAAYEEASKS